MRHDCRGATFGAEPISGGGRCCEWRTEHLDGHVAAERLVGGTEDQCSSSFANQLLKTVATSDKIAWLQRSLLAL
jgi:hypothetical protein